MNQTSLNTSVSLIFSISVLVAGLSSCKKELVHVIDPDFIGSWGHKENSNERWSIQIDDDSYGTVTLYDSLFNFIEAYGENPKRWRIKQKINTLKHGFDNVSFQIDQHPTVANNDLINGLDTILQGETYVILNGDYFVKK